MTITEFLLARIAEDEALVTGMDCICSTRRRPDCPDRILDECEARRLLIAAALEHAATIDGEWGCCHSADEIGAEECPREHLDEQSILCILAAVYADHPDYNEEWR